jgi:hypothetical protein
VSSPESRLDRALRSIGELPPPPPSAALDGMVASARPVQRRRPGRALGLVLGGSLLVLAAFLAVVGLRNDLDALPAWWFWTMSVAWLAASVAPLAIALHPRSGSMFASVPRSRALAIAIPVLAVAMAVLLRIDAPPATLIPPTGAALLRSISRCLLMGLAMSAGPMALGMLALRRSPQPLHTRWIGAALGAASGTLAALLLHAHCWVGGAVHTGVAHAGQAALGAILGALLAPWLTARNRTP